MSYIEVCGQPKSVTKPFHAITTICSKTECLQYKKNPLRDSVTVNPPWWHPGTRETHVTSHSIVTYSVIKCHSVQKFA